VPDVIEASCPVRICDIGGWTDTWFGGPGRVVNIAVTPGVEVSIRPTARAGTVIIDATSLGVRYPIVPGKARTARHPLLEAAVDAFPPPADRGVEVSVRSAVPPGCGTGTSAAVCVALVGALTALRFGRVAPREIAYAAHRLEVEVLGTESGIQDQLSAALGGINYLEIEPYPESTVYTLPAWDDLGVRLTLVFLGRAHHSSDIHRQVIEDEGSHRSEVLSRLRAAAVDARTAVLTRDLHAFGQAMIANTDAQRSLHPELVGVDADRVIEVARMQGAIGWKVNGAGGDGGSVTVLSGSAEAKVAFDRRVVMEGGSYRVLPVELSAAGLTVRGTL